LTKRERQSSAAPLEQLDEYVKLQLFPVVIDRGRTILHVRVPEHEIAVLEAVHGADNVRVDDNADYDEGLFVNDADTEYARLQSKYRRVNSSDSVLLAFPAGGRSIEGFAINRGLRKSAAQSTEKDYRKEAMQAAIKEAGE
jgi:hypothetical protein